MTVVQSVMHIFKSLGLKSLPYLPVVMPPFINLLRTASDSMFRDFLFQQLGYLVSVVKQHIREYLAEIFEVCSSHQLLLRTLVD